MAELVGLAGRVAGRLAGWQAGRLAGRLDGWMDGWMEGWLAGWLTDWLSTRRVRSTAGLEGDGGWSLAGGWLGWRRRWSEGGVTKGGETNGVRTAVTAEHRASGDCHPSGICCVTCAPSLAEAMRSRATGQTGCGQGGRRLRSTVRPSHTRSCRIASTVWGPTARGHLAGRSAHRDPH